MQVANYRELHCGTWETRERKTTKGFKNRKELLVNAYMGCKIISPLLHYIPRMQCEHTEQRGLKLMQHVRVQAQ